MTDRPAPAPVPDDTSDVSMPSAPSTGHSAEAVGDFVEQLPAPVSGDSPELDDPSSGTVAESAEAPAGNAEVGASQLDAIAATLDELVDASHGYHARAQRREAVIDTMHAELEGLRRGERRSLLRPLLTDVCRMRDDLLRQADQLPAVFDAERAAGLLRSYADSLEIAIQDNGVTTYQPEPGERFEPRSHRGVGKMPTTDPTLVGRIATVQAAGYRDIETGLAITTARVVVYVLAEPPAEAEPTPAEAASTPAALEPTPADPASAPAGDGSLGFPQPDPALAPGPD